jgi:hypothetical protein
MGAVLEATTETESNKVKFWSVPAYRSQICNVDASSVVAIHSRNRRAEGSRLAEDGWNSRNPEKIALGYTLNSLFVFAKNLSVRSSRRNRFILKNPIIVRLLIARIFTDAVDGFY